MITLQDFQCATFEEKCDVVTCYSDYLITRHSRNHKIYLYAAKMFFIEVHYSTVDKKVQRIIAFNEIERLDPYTEIVSLADLNL